jgi:hypothetical protein
MIVYSGEEPLITLTTAFLTIASPRCEMGIEAVECGMEIVIVSMGDTTVAGVAVPRRRIDYQARVGGILVLYTAITAVADDAADLAMDTLHEVGILQEDLFPCLQRRHRATSAFAFGFLRLLLFLNHLGHLLQKLYIAVAVDTGAGCRLSGS